MSSAEKSKSNTVLILVIVGFVLIFPLLGCLVVFIAGGMSWFMVRDAAPVPVTPVTTSSPNEFSMRYALERWQVDQGLASCPTLDDLDSHGLLMPGQRNDEWGHPWSISCSGSQITATSMGPDGAAGSSDDVRFTVGN